MTDDLDYDGGIEFETGRQAVDDTDIPDWISLSGISAGAHSLYTKLKMHCNRRRGDAKAWPGTDVLAMMMGVSRGDKIAPYLRELVAIGAIGIRRERVPGRYVYTIHSLPEDGYAGPVSLEEWYARHKAEIAAGRAARKRDRDHRKAAQGAVVGKKPQVSPVTPKTGQQAKPPQTTLPVTPKTGSLETPKTGSLVTPETGEQVTPKTGSLLYVLEPPRNEPPPPAPSAPPAVGQEEEDTPAQEHPEAAQLLDQDVLTGAPPHGHPSGPLRARIVAGIAAALAAGWPRAQLAQELAGRWAGVGHVGALLDARVARLGPPPPRRAAPAQRPPQSCPVPECDSHHGGAGLIMVIGPGGEKADRCPSCYPRPAPAETLLPG